MRQRLIRGAGLVLALALHAAVLAPWWLAPQTLQGGSGGPVSSGRSLNLSLTEAPAKPEKAPEQPRPEPESEPEPEPEPEPEALKTEQKPEEKKEEAEPDDPAEPEPDEEPEDEKEKQAMAREEAARPPAGDGREAGPGAHDQGERDNAWNRYLGEIQRTVEQRKQYPRRARMRRREGVVRIRFRVDEQGGIKNLELAASSGSHLLDRHVEQLMRTIELPAPPEQVSVKNKTITLPVRFRLR